MKICQPHWDQMRAKLNELGIGHLGHKSGEEALVAIAKQVERGSEAELPDEEWDPLMAMNMNFWSMAVSNVGLAAMTEDYGCPLCDARASFDLHNTPTGRCSEPECNIQIQPGECPWDLNMISSCAEAMRKHAIERGLVKTS